MLLSLKYDQKTETQECFLSKVDEDGNISRRIDISEAIDQDQGNYITDIVTDENGNFIVLTGCGKWSVVLMCVNMPNLL